MPMTVSIRTLVKGCALAQVRRNSLATATRISAHGGALGPHAAAVTRRAPSVDKRPRLSWYFPTPDGQPRGVRAARALPVDAGAEEKRPSLPFSSRAAIYRAPLPRPPSARFVDAAAAHRPPADPSAPEHSRRLPAARARAALPPRPHARASWRRWYRRTKGRGPGSPIAARPRLSGRRQGQRGQPARHPRGVNCVGR